MNKISYANKLVSDAKKKKLLQLNLVFHRKLVHLHLLEC